MTNIFNIYFIGLCSTKKTPIIERFYQGISYGIKVPSSMSRWESLPGDTLHELKWQEGIPATLPS
jgi:hypothetical protein